MIHSLSGGIIAENAVYIFAKVEVCGEILWYLSPRGVHEGGKVLVPYGKGEFPAEGSVLKIIEASPQCAPVPMKHLKEIIKII